MVMAEVGLHFPTDQQLLMVGLTQVQLPGTSRAFGI